MPNRTRTRIKLLVLAMLALPLALLAQKPSAAENKAIYCSYQGCPAGQRCLNCNGNWVCIYVYPNDPDRVPSGCGGGPV